MHPNLRSETAGIESFKSVIDTAKGALNTALLTNGGAAVAMLAYCGAIASKAGLRVPIWIVCSMGGFAAGVLVAAVASGLAYLSQHAEHWNDAPKSYWTRRATIYLIVASYVLFALACVAAGIGVQATSATTA